MKSSHNQPSEAGEEKYTLACLTITSQKTATKPDRVGMDVGEYLKRSRTFNINVSTTLFTNLIIYIPQPIEKKGQVFYSFS